MKKIALSDVLDIAEYERRRKEYRARLMKIKDERRIRVGPLITYLFETFDTMLYQVQEMTRAERIVEEKAILAEIETYNELIPDKNQLSATMLIEIDNPVTRLEFLTRTVDLPEHTFLTINAQKVQPHFDPRQGTAEKLSSVQYVKFNLTDIQVEKFYDPASSILFGFDHLLYTHAYELNPQQKKILHEDLSGRI